MRKWEKCRERVRDAELNKALQMFWRWRGIHSAMSLRLCILYSSFLCQFGKAKALDKSPFFCSLFFLQPTQSSFSSYSLFKVGGIVRGVEKRRASIADSTLSSSRHPSGRIPTFLSSSPFSYFSCLPIWGTKILPASVPLQFPPILFTKQVCKMQFSP